MTDKQDANILADREQKLKRLIEIAEKLRIHFASASWRGTAEKPVLILRGHTKSTTLSSRKPGTR